MNPSAYKHVVKVPTYSFEESPKVVGDACYYLTKVTRRVVTLPSAITAGPFNEVLSVGYSKPFCSLSPHFPSVPDARFAVQGSKMNFHDDGEKGLGPLVTTLSLGGEAAMAFRKKDKKSKVKTEDVPLEPADTTAPAAKKAPRTLLTLKLVHADITIMEGEDVQKYFEHAITAKEGLRFGALPQFPPLRERSLTAPCAHSSHLPRDRTGPLPLAHTACPSQRGLSWSTQSIPRARSSGEVTFNGYASAD